MRPRSVLTGVALAAVLLALTTAVSGEAMTHVVSPEGPYTTIEAALEASKAGDTIEVRGGTYRAPLMIDKTVTLRGVGAPVIDGYGSGSLVRILAPDVVFEGFTLRNTGTSQSHEDTAIVVQAERVTVAHNILENVLFGIYFAEASNGIARDNHIRGNEQVAEGIRGDSIRVYYSDNVLLEGNEATTSRDMLIWFANDITIRGNTFHHNRYGLHVMYSENALVEQNRLEHNSVGAYLMYSTGLTVLGNNLNNNRGPSGYGLALKDMNEVVVRENTIAGNRAGLYLDNSPATYDTYNTFTGNLFAYNDIGIAALPSVARNHFQTNAFLDNTQQVSVLGRGNLQANIWHQNGIGNYWSDYAGYDEDGDGTGDLPYRAEKLFDSLVDTYPSLRLFNYSPAAQAIDFAAAAFPSLRPDPKLVDETPSLRFALPTSTPTSTGAPSALMIVVSVLMVTLSLLIIGSGQGIFFRPKLARAALSRRFVRRGAL